MHCVQNSFGANLHRSLNTKGVYKIIQKGTDAGLDSYSAFFDNDKIKKTGLEAYLKTKNIDAVYIMGLGTESSVKYTALDAVSLGYKTFLIEDGCRGRDFTEGGVENALIQVQAEGVRIVQSNFILNEFDRT
jgi:nicotinamidase/pyrazinamidase